MHHRLVMETRGFTNRYPDFSDESPFDDQTQKLDEGFASLLNEEIEALLRKLYTGLEEWLDYHDYSVYTGTSGIALLHLKLHTALHKGPDKSFLKKALVYIEKPLDRLKRRRVSFLCGDAGPLAIGAVLYKQLGKEETCRECLDRLFNRQSDVIKDASLPSELLFGRVGYLYSLLFVRRHLGNDSVQPELIDQVYEDIIKQGVNKAKKEDWECPLMFDWHDKVYLGAAHGVVGILYILMQVEGEKYETNLETLVKPTLDYIITHKFPSGNFPSSVGSSTGDKLVQWCHGAPGWTQALLKAYEIFKDKKYLDEALSCGEVTWKRGLLKKGYGVCHGVAGNAYAFLALFKATRDHKHIYRAWKFAEWCFDYGTHGCKDPDRPMSLFEGMAGTVYFLCDLMDPLSYGFPAYDV